MPLEAKPVRLAEHDCLTPFGDRVATHAALVAGRSALRMVPVFGHRGGETVPLALLPGRDLDETTPPAWLAAVCQLLEPMAAHGWGRSRRPVCFASSNFGVGSLYAHQQTNAPEALRYGTPKRSVQAIRQALGWGPHLAVFSHACVSSHIALLHASRLVAAGVADEVLVVSFDFLSPFVAGGFYALKILNSARPLPYQEREIGAIGLGDGAAYAVVTRDRGDFALTHQHVHNEMYHFTANDPTGAGFRAAFESIAKRTKNVWFKGHGTGTLEAGRLECQAVSTLLPAAPIVGWKGALGHTLGSCGLVELVLTSQAMLAGVAPATVGATRPTFVPQVALEPFDTRTYEGAVCSCNAFGGAHAALVLTHA